MLSNTFHDELKSLEESIQADNEWTELKAYQRERLVEFIKLSENLVSNMDKMISIWEEELTKKGFTTELNLRLQDLGTDARSFGRIFKLINKEFRGLTDRILQIKRGIESHLENKNV